MNKAQDTEALLTEFIKAFGASLDPRLWVKLIEEELVELEEALVEGDKANILKEFTDLRYVVQGFLLTGEYFSDLAPHEEVTRVHDLLQDCLTVQEESGLHTMFSQNQIDNAFYLVHCSNMSKLGPDGKPIKREDGKVLKGPNYKPANLEEIVKETK